MVPSNTTTGDASKAVYGLRTRVRTGCLTCKRRKVKCDEARPRCLRCCKGGYTCDGYADKGFPSANGLAGAHVSVDRYLSAGLKCTDANEYQSLLFYLKACRLFGPFDNSFWTRFVPQISDVEPAVRHAVVALSAFQRGLCTASLGGVANVGPLYREVALEHYNLSMRALQRRMSSSGEDSLRVVLISCLLFTLLECQMGNYATGALTHLRGGLEILGNMRTSQNDRLDDDEHPLSDVAMVEKQLLHIFAELELQAAFVASGRREENLGGRRDHLRIPAAPFVHEFNSLSKAKFVLENELSALFDYYEWSMSAKYTHVPADSQELRRRYNIASASLEQWSTAFSRYLFKYQKGFSRDELRGATALKLKHKFGRLLLEQSLRLPGDTDVPVRTEEESILKMIGSLVEIDSPKCDVPAGRTKPPLVEFSVGANIIMPLSLISMYGTTLSLRRQAVELLAAHPRREGFWDGLVFAKMARQILTKDELDRLSSPDGGDNIQNGSRIIYIEDMSSDERTGTLLIHHNVTEGEGTTREKIEW